jgi:hypothetical protein
VRDLVEHWEGVYRSGGPHSWDQTEPALTVELLEAAGVRPDSAVIDVGGGDGALAGALISRGFSDLTVLDLSAQGLAAGRTRVGSVHTPITWVVADVCSWRATRTFDVWHDRAAFHFLVDPTDRAAYGATLRTGTAPGSLAVVGTFAGDGPAQCSGLPVSRYDPGRLTDALRVASDLDWELLRTAREEHHTPAGAVQPFTWVVLRRPG